jgi:hypothetical protein
MSSPLVCCASFRCTSLRQRNPPPVGASDGRSIRGPHYATYIARSLTMFHPRHARPRSADAAGQPRHPDKTTFEARGSAGSPLSSATAGSRIPHCQRRGATRLHLRAAPRNASAVASSPAMSARALSTRLAPSAAKRGGDRSPDSACEAALLAVPMRVSSRSGSSRRMARPRRPNPAAPRDQARRSIRTHEPRRLLSSAVFQDSASSFT